MIGIGLFIVKTSTKTEPEFTVTKEKDQTIYTITQKEDEYIEIESKDLRANTSTDEMSTKNSQVPSTITYTVTFSVAQKEGKATSEVKMSVSDTKYGEMDAYKSSRSFDKTFCAFVPYNQSKNGAVGVFIFSDQEQTIEAVKKILKRPKSKSVKMIF
ncbi:hypothetical protein [Enterococcus bulliens]